MVELSEQAVKTLSNPNLAFLATVMSDGSPQVTPMWVDVEDGHVLMNTAVGRLKERNIRRDPRVALSLAARDNDFDKFDIRGRVVEFIEGDRAFDHIDRMAKKYLGEEKYGWLSPGEQRVILRIEPLRLASMS
jgi:PPOX class probable F420-dependent enzyme